jgi:hypothetical protein
MALDNLARNGVLGMAGASGAVASSISDAADFIIDVYSYAGQVMSPQEQFAIANSQLFREALPQMSNITRAMLARKYGRTFYESGESLEYEGSWLNLVASGALGLTTEREVLFHLARDEAWDTQEEINALTKDIHRFVMQMSMHLRDGDLDYSLFNKIALIAAEMADAAPDGHKMAVLEAALTGFWGENDMNNSPVNVLAEYAMNNLMSKESARDRIMAMKSDWTESEIKAINYILDTVMEQRMLNDEQMQQRFKQTRMGQINQEGTE